jgi:polysaccharide biosynthesis transport protein
MSAQNNASPDDIDITSLWAALKRSLLKLTAVSALAMAATYGVLSTMAPRFTSEAQLAIVSKSFNPLPDDPSKASVGDSTNKMDPAAINTHVKALTASDLLIKVAKGLNLAKNPEFNSNVGDLDTFTSFQRKIGMAGARPGESDEDRVLAAVTKQLEVSSAKESRSINVRFTSANPELAAQFANTLSNAYRASLVTDTIVETEDANKALMPKVEQLRKEVIDVEAEVERTRVQIDRTIGGQQRTTLIDQRMSELQTELTKADAVKNDADVKWKTAKELMGTGSASALPELQKSPLIQSLEGQRVRLERQISELSATLLPGHPRMQQLNADLGGLRRQLTAEISKFSQGLEKEARSAALRVETINKQIGELKTKVVNSSGDDAKLRALEATAKSKRVELERLEKKVQDNRTVVSTKTVPIEARLVTQARPTVTPTFPKKLPFSLLAMVGTFLFGLAWVVTRELLLGARPGAARNPGGNNPPGRGVAGNNMQAAMASPRLALGYAPAAAPAAAAMATAEAKASEAAQALAARSAAVLNKGTAVGAAGAARMAASAAAPVETGNSTAITTEVSIARLIKNGGVQPGYRTLVAGDTSIADTSDEAVDIAVGLTRAGKQVVLVDWDMAGKGFAESIGVAHKPGITDLLAGSVAFEDVIGRIPGGDTHFIACGDPLADPSSIDADRLNLVLDALDEAYDHIVVAGAYQGTQALFEAIQGRFDSGITICDSKRRPQMMEDAPGSFLGFEVTDLDIMKIDRASAAADLGAAKRKPAARSSLGSAEARP